MMKLFQMETPSFLLTKFSEYLMRMQMGILTLRWQLNSLHHVVAIIVQIQACHSIPFFDGHLDQELTIYIIQEFLIAIDMSINGSPEEKLRWGFRIFDKDGSGKFQWNFV